MTTLAQAEIATVTSDDFAVGTFVMLHSFLRHNRWFRGAIHVIHNGLGGGALELVGSVPGVIFRRTSETLSRSVAALAEANPALRSRAARFLSLDAFAIEGAGKLIFVDSDMVFMGDISEIVAREEPLLACPDGATVRGNARDRATLAEVAAAASHTLDKTFNAGLMVIGPSLRNAAEHEALLALTDPAVWERLQTDHTDQAVLNLRYEAVVALVSVRYNLLLLHRIDSMRHEPIGFEEARVIHFNGPAKPWLLDRLPRAVKRDPAFVRALQHWFAAFTDALTARQLNQSETVR